MAYAVFDRQDEDAIISGVFTSEAAAEALMETYADDDGYEHLYVDKVCDQHGTYGPDQPVTACACWDEEPYEDERGFFGPGTGASSAFV